MELISFALGGGLIALLKLAFAFSKNKRESREKMIDDRIIAWQTISEKSEARLEELERKLSITERDFRSLERYVATLEQTVSTAAPPVKLPPRPVLISDAVIANDIVPISGVPIPLKMIYGAQQTRE
ncbi:MAG: hypothetical protein FWC55_03345 [Firmicutes bacterium]|nr:hypothetical protein [Bacillota bacterium]